jgi:hypothetical protein
MRILGVDGWTADEYSAEWHHQMFADACGIRRALKYFACPFSFVPFTLLFRSRYSTPVKSVKEGSDPN